MTNDDQDRRLAADLARLMALMCVRNTRLEDIHAGQHPTTLTGDYSDVVVIDAEGREIPWAEASRISDAEMRALMKDVVNHLYTFMVRADDPQHQAKVAQWAAVAARWDDPELQW